MKNLREPEEEIFDSAFSFMLSFYKNSPANPCKFLGEEKGRHMMNLIAEYFDKMEKELPLICLKKDICKLEIDILELQYQLSIKKEILKKSFAPEEQKSVNKESRG